MQHGQVFELKRPAVDGRPVWAYRYRTGGPGRRLCELRSQEIAAWRMTISRVDKFSYEWELPDRRVSGTSVTDTRPFGIRQRTR